MREPRDLSDYWEEFSKLKLDLLPCADEKEMKLLERTFQAPERYKDQRFEEMKD